MQATTLARELYRRDPLLALVGWGHLAVLAVVLAAAPFDQRTILGLNPWIKPSKFLVSVAIYMWTVAWFLPYLRGPRWAVRLISAGVALVMTAEIVCIVTQSARGVRSHFNDTTALDQAIFGVMGAGILVNSILLALLALLLFARHTDLPRPYLWAVRLGVLLILAGSAEGLVMINQRAHAVGVADGGPGLPYVNWSTEAGDLRAAHAVGWHGLQAIPLFAFGLARFRPRLGENRQLTCVLALAGGYLAVGLVLFRQAMQGHPLLPLW